MRLLSINSYDKDAYVRRWITQAYSLDPNRWKLQVASNGPQRSEFDAETIHCDNPPPVLTMGWRECIQATHPHDVDIVASVHAKTWLPDLSLLDHLADRMLSGGHDAVLLPQVKFENVEDGAELLFLLLFRSAVWERLTAAIVKDDHGLWNEVVTARAITSLRLNTLRVTGHTEEPVNPQNYWIRNIDSTGLDLFGCEPGRTGFGHYLRGGYHQVSVSDDGVVTREIP